MRNHKADLREGKSYRVQVNRIGETHVKKRGQSELCACTHRQHPAMDKDCDARVRRHGIEHRPYPWILNGVAMHCRKQAQAMETTGVKGGAHTLDGARGRRVRHKISIKPVRVSADRSRNG